MKSIRKCIAVKVSVCYKETWSNSNLLTLQWAGPEEVLECTTVTNRVWEISAERQPAPFFCGRPPWQSLGESQIYLFFFLRLVPPPPALHQPLLPTTSLLLRRLRGGTSEPCTAINGFRTCTLTMTWSKVAGVTNGKDNWSKSNGVKRNTKSQHSRQQCIIF